MRHWMQNVPSTKVPNFSYSFAKRPVKLLSCVQLSAIQWTVAYQIPPSMESSRQEYWSGLPFPSPGDLPDPGIKPRSPALQANTLLSEPPVLYLSCHRTEKTIHLKRLWGRFYKPALRYSTLPEINYSVYEILNLKPKLNVLYLLAHTF